MLPDLLERLRREAEQREITLTERIAQLAEERIAAEQRSRGFGEQLVTLARPFIVTADGRVVTGTLIDFDDSLRANAQRLGCSVKILAKLLDAEKAWRRTTHDVSSEGAV